MSVARLRPDASGTGLCGLLLAGLLSAVLAGCSAVCLAAVIPLYVRRGDRAYALVCALVIVVLLLAASGILTAGH